MWCRCTLPYIDVHWYTLLYTAVCFCLLQGIVIANCVTYEPLKAELSNRTIVYPVWGNILGWMFVICAFLWVPGYAIYTLLCKYKDGRTWKERLAMAISPEQEHKSIRNGKQIRRFQVCRLSPLISAYINSYSIFSMIYIVYKIIL